MNGRRRTSAIRAGTAGRWTMLSLVPRIAGGALLLFLVLPLVGLLVRAIPRGIAGGLQNPLVGPALRLSLITTLCSTAVVLTLGTALAWTVSRANGRGQRAVETLVQLPVVIPPAVAGVAMLLVFGRRGLLGSVLESLGIELPFTTAAVVLAEIFVSAPFFLQAAIAAFRRVDDDLLVVARTLGASPTRVFFRVALPLSWHALVGGAAMSWARAFGEFGATLMFAGNLPGRTQTLPLAVYTVLESDVDAAQSLSVLMILVAFAILILLRWAFAWPRLTALAPASERR